MWFETKDKSERKMDAMEEMIREFIEKGFVKIENAFEKEWAQEGRTIMWKDLGCDPEDRSTWTKPIVRLPGYGQTPFNKAVNTPVLYRAFDALVGKGRWQPRSGLGTFPVRFPGDEDPGDTGWHAEASFQGKDGSWRTNVHSTGRALLMLFLFSDVESNDAPTRILVGSHLDVPGILEPYGDEGLDFISLAGKFTARSLDRPVALATGEAGTVYLCHPFLIHGAQPHRGTEPRFMGQPPLLGEVSIERKDADYSPVETAIRLGLGRR